MMRFAILSFLLLMTFQVASFRFDLFHPDTEMKSVIRVLEAQQTSPFLIVTDNLWADHLHHIWTEEFQSIIVTERDLWTGYTRRRKPFRCNLATYWLGKQAPPKGLHSFGTWKKVAESSVAGPTIEFELYVLEPSPSR